MPKIAIIGAGFSGLSAAAYLSAYGHEVEVFEKNETAGGRARQWHAQGYAFDMGPSWYWMPGIFEQFFQDFGSAVSHHYELRLLDPSFDMVFEGGKKISVPADYGELSSLFEALEQGGAASLERFMRQARQKYEATVNRLARMPGLSLKEFADPVLIKAAFELDLFSSFRKHLRKYFSHPQLRALMEFPVLFLGAMPDQIPALYSFMNYAGLKLGTWYPVGGFGKLVAAMKKTGVDHGATYRFRSPVEKILVERERASAVVVHGKEQFFDAVVATGDYHHVETSLLPEGFRNYSDSYWQKKTMAPSALIFFVGINKKIEGLQHHTLFFDEDMDLHAHEIYKDPRWPSRPLFYLCCPSRTDNSVAPPGHENLFFLMPLAPGLQDDESIREKYFGLMMQRLEKLTGEKNLQAHIDFKKAYGINDFIADYYSYKGNAYGLANTLRQTALLKPSIRNKKLKNLFYAGQLTVPGPGVPPCIISGKLAAQQVQKFFKQHEVFI